MAKGLTAKAGPLALAEAAMVTLAREDGQTLLEYALIIACIAVGTAVVLLAVGPAFGTAFGAVTGVIEDYTPL